MVERGGAAVSGGADHHRRLMQLRIGRSSGHGKLLSAIAMPRQRPIPIRTRGRMEPGHLPFGQSRFRSRLLTETALQQAADRLGRLFARGMVSPNSSWPGVSAQALTERGGGRGRCPYVMAGPGPATYAWRG